VVVKSTIFRDITPCSPLSVNRRFEGTYRPHLQGRKNKFSKKPAWKQVESRIIRQPELIFWTLKMEAICSSETSVDTRRATRRYIPDDCILQIRHVSADRIYAFCLYFADRLCGLVVRVSGYRYRGPVFDSRRFQIFWEAVGLERGPLSLVRRTEEVLGRNSSGFGEVNRD
jgi:hypothetical protein